MKAYTQAKITVMTLLPVPTPLEFILALVIVITSGWVICEDINECFDDVHSCDTSIKCLNTDGSYRCECRWFVGDGSINDDVNEYTGDSVNDCVEHSFCTNGSYICAYKDIAWL